METYAAILLYRLPRPSQNKFKSAAPKDQPTNPTGPEFLLLNDSFSSKRHWAPPKGKCGQSTATEDMRKYAARELTEMTGLRPTDYQVLEGFKPKEMKYLSGNRPKRVIVFLARLTNNMARILVGGEGIQFQWLAEKQACDRATYKSMADIIHEAAGFVAEREAEFAASKQRANTATKSAGVAAAGQTGKPEARSWKDSGAPAGGRSNDTENPLYKTKLCEKFKDGTCTYGAKCVFAHGEQELRARPKEADPVSGSTGAGIDIPKAAGGSRPREGSIKDGSASGSLPRSFQGRSTGFHKKEEKSAERSQQIEHGDWRSSAKSASSSWERKGQPAGV